MKYTLAFLEEGPLVEEAEALGYEVRVFAVGRLCQQQALSPSRPTRAIYPAVDLERFDPERLPAPTEARSRLSLTTQVPLIGILARLQRWKGLDVFLEAAARVARVDPEARVVVVGGPHFDEPALHAELVEQAYRTGILDRAYFAGHQTEIPLWIQALDVVVNASIEPEPFGMTIIESMALGKAVTATRQGGPLKIIDDGKDGLLIQPGDPAALASSILRLTKDADDRSAIGKVARRRAQQFGTGRLASELAQHLTEEIR